MSESIIIQLIISVAAVAGAVIPVIVTENHKTRNRIDESITGLSTKVDKLEADIENVKTENKELSDELKTSISEVREENLENNAIQARVRILQFNDELIRCTDGAYATKDHFEQTLTDIDTYERYCSDHPKFKNSITISASKRIKQKYEKGEFLI